MLKKVNNSSADKTHSILVYVSKDILLIKLLEFYTRIGLDLSFQSQERWTSKQKSEYITSLIKGMAPSKIILVNIEGCMENFHKDSEDYRYFDGWRKLGYKYISIDGNNRTITLFEFLNNKIRLEHGTYRLTKGTVKVDSVNDTYETLDSTMREHIDNNVFLSICEYVSATRSDCSESFIKINSGMKLNGQELRNAILVPFASAIRELSEKYGKTSFRTISGMKNNSRRAIDEQFVDLSIYYTFGVDRSISKPTKDEAYMDNSDVSYEFFNGGRKLIEETMDIIAKYADEGFKDVSTLMNFFIAMKYLNKNHYNILDKESFFKWFMASENKRVSDSTILAETKEGEYRAYFGCNKDASAKFLKARYDYIVKDLQLISDKIVCRPDPERLFTIQQRYKLWERQGGICTITGKQIPENEINNHTLWAADHIYPHSKGGPTTLENGQLICKQANLEKSAKLNYQSQEVAT